MKEGAILSKKIKNTNTPMIFGEKEKQVFMDATTCHICEKPLEDDGNGRMDHLSNIKQWLEILSLDLRKIPIEKEMEKAMNEFDGIKYTWKDIPVLTVKKKVKVKVVIQVGDESKTVKLDELMKSLNIRNLLMEMKL